MSSPTSGDAGAMRALILQHEDPTPPGHVTEWLEGHGAEMQVLRIDLEEPQVDPGRYDLIVSLGSEFAAFDDSHEFVRREAQLMRRAADANVPILGLCFGGQMLARVLGGEVYRGSAAEIGWLPVRTNDPDLVPEGPWFQWHFDVMTAPAGATVIAETDLGTQAFALGRSLGLQFHPEVTPEIMDAWVRAYRHELDAEGVDPDALLEETNRCAQENKRTSWQLLEGFLDRVAGLGSRAAT
jgi:GMP synthase-like glutamine amidotransferase